MRRRMFLLKEEEAEKKQAGQCFASLSLSLQPRVTRESRGEERRGEECGDAATWSSPMLFTGVKYSKI